MRVEAAPNVGVVGRAKQAADAIEELAKIRREGRTVATDGERVKLSGWPGWGPLAPMFAPTNETWEDIERRVRAALPEDDVKMGHLGTYSAFYTPPDVAKAMWDLLAALGFRGGRVLEPGCGGGVFMQAAPEGAHVVGVERDPTSAAITRLRHPDHEVIESPIQEARLRSDFDAVIGNVPFGNVGVYDATAPREVTRSLHNYCIWKAVSSLLPGGIAVLLTSRHTLDAPHGARSALADVADFVGAIRLANGDLGGGTDACADITIWRRKDGSDTKPHAWLGSVWNEIVPAATVNEWWTDHKTFVLGDMQEGSTPEYGLNLLVKRRPEDPPAADGIRRVTPWLVDMATDRGMLFTALPDATTFDADDLLVDGRLDGELWFDADGALRQLIDGKAKAFKPAPAELVALVKMRDLAVDLIEREAEHWRPDTDMEPVRRDLAATYQRYARRYGYLNRCKLATKYTLVKPNTRLAKEVDEGFHEVIERDGKPFVKEIVRTTPLGPLNTFRKDPKASLLFAIEVYDDETEKGGPAPILGARQNMPPFVPTHTDDPQEALAWSLNYRAKVDVPYIAELLGVDAGQVPELLGDAVFVCPETRVLLAAEEYLSGDVRRKLAVAKKAAAFGSAFQRNVDALEKACPRWLVGPEITVQLGAPWIDKDYIAQWVNELLCEVHPSESANPRNRAAEIVRLSNDNRWEINVATVYRNSVAATATYGMPSMDAFRLIALALNGKVPVVQVPVGDGKYVKDEELSLLATTKQQELKEQFAEWMWTEPVRARTLETYYNENFNNLVARRYDGSHITIDGMAPAMEPYAHQPEYVARALATPAGLCGHPVGAGKTATMAMTALKLKQLGLVRKPLAIVPNHLIEQTERQFRQWFPGARIFAAGSEMFRNRKEQDTGRTTRDGREQFAARVATTDWDLVIMPHSQFDRIPVNPATEAAYLDQQEADLDAAIREACPDGELTGRMIKAAAKRRDALRERIRSLRSRVHGHDNGVTFEQLGIDYLLLDEAHYYKNLSLPCRTDGFSIRPSKRATSLDIKLGWLATRGSGRFASLFTGTPISNSMLELYVMLHYTMPEYMRQIGLGSADAWSAMYVLFETVIDVTVDGGRFKTRTKPTFFVNAPELRVLLSQAADIRTAKQLGLKRPAFQVLVEVCQPTDAQAAYSLDLVDRAEALKNRWNPPENGDNMLKICGDGRRMATDPRLVGIVDDEPGKLERAATRIVAEWKANPEELQIVFCDLGTPNEKDTQTYGRLRRLLTDMGMPVGRIRFAHDAKTDGAKAQLFAECRNGSVSVVVGSTDKLGVGTNIQDRVIAMHHLDAPYRPADVEQRDGRGVRPKNRNKMVRIYRYVTERTFDAYMWQLLTTKIGYIEQMMSGEFTGREIEDVSGEQTMSFSAIKASATGQPLLLEKAKIEAKVKKLRNSKRFWKMNRDQFGHDIPLWTQKADSLEREASIWQAIGEAITAEPNEGDAERLHEMAKEHGWRRPTGTVLGLTFKFDSWYNDMGRDKGNEPRANIEIGGERIQRRWRSWWKPKRILDELRDIVADATSKPDGLREAAAGLRKKIADAETEAAKPFGQDSELIGLLARLDQIEAALRRKATGQDEDGDAFIATAGIDLGGTVVWESSETHTETTVVDVPATADAPDFADIEAELAGIEAASEPEPQRTPPRRAGEIKVLHVDASGVREVEMPGLTSPAADTDDEDQADTLEAMLAAILAAAPPAPEPAPAPEPEVDPLEAMLAAILAAAPPAPEPAPAPEPEVDPLEAMIAATLAAMEEDLRASLVEAFGDSVLF